MYIPEPFKVSSPEAIEAFLSKFGFATVITPGESLQVTHCPVLARATAEGTVLEAHFARANPHCRSMSSGHPTLAIFSGPHAYISPRWYRKLPAVPTWNYGVVHVHGIPRVVDDAAAIGNHFRRLVERYEGPGGLPEDILPDSLVDQLRAGILCFEMHSLRIEAKFKLGQNRGVEDQRSMRRHLEASPEARSRELADFMREFGTASLGVDDP